MITNNDLLILALFNDYEYLPSTYIGRMMPHMHPVAVKNRLTILRHELGLLDVPTASWEAANARYRPAIYQRTAKGTAALRERGYDAVDVRRKREFKHELGGYLFRGSLHIGTMEHPSLSLITTAEILDHQACPSATRSAKEPFKIKAPFTYKGRNGKMIHIDDASIVHDLTPLGIAHTEGSKTVRIFMPGIEFDRSTERLDATDNDRPSIEKKLRQVLALSKYVGGVDGYREHYGIPNAVIPFVTVTQSRMLGMMRILHEITAGKGSDRILFAHVNDFTTFEKLPDATGWAMSYDYQRVGYKPYNFLEAFGINKKVVA